LNAQPPVSGAASSSAPPHVELDEPNGQFTSKTFGSSVRVLIGRLLQFSPTVFPPHTEELIRSELFGIERLEQHAESLATAQTVTARPEKGRRLDSRLEDKGRALFDAYRGVEKAVREERHITPADEWPLDNFHVAQEQIRQVRDDLPHGFYRGLPKLSDGPLKGYLRVSATVTCDEKMSRSDRVDHYFALRLACAYY